MEAVEFYLKSSPNKESKEQIDSKDPFENKLLELNFTIQHTKFASKWRQILQKSLNLQQLNNNSLQQLEENDHQMIRPFTLKFFELLKQHVNPNLPIENYKHYVKDYAWTHGEMRNSFKVLAALARNATLQSFAWPAKEEHFWAMQNSQEILFLTEILEKRNLQYGLSLLQSQEVFAAVHAFTYEVVSRVKLQIQDQISQENEKERKVHLIRLEKKGIMELNLAKVPAADQKWLQASLMCATLDRVEPWPFNSAVAHFAVPLELLFGGWFLNPHNQQQQWFDYEMRTLDHHRLFGVNSERSITFFAGVPAFLHDQQQSKELQVKDFGPAQKYQWRSGKEAELLLRNFGIISYISKGQEVVSATDNAMLKEAYEEFL